MNPKRIAARVHIGTAKGAQTVLHQFAHARRQPKPPGATDPCAPLEFQSTVGTPFRVRTLQRRHTTETQGAQELALDTPGRAPVVSRHDW
jgi:hypothetical protein